MTTKTKIIATILSLSTVPAVAPAQVAPAPAPAAAVSNVPSFKPGWIAQGVSYKGSVIGEVPLASVVVGASQDDAFAVLAKQTGVKANGLILKGVINAAETGTYGVVLDIQDGGQYGYCSYTLSIDGKSALVAKDAREPLVADKAIELPAGRHPVEISVGCNNHNVSNVHVALKVKLPSADAIAAPRADFIIHATRASGD